MIELTPVQARRLVLRSQGLHKRAPFGGGHSGLLACIHQLGYVQIDTISVIKRAHLHTFWTRIPTFCESQLDILQRERKVFEYWSHAAAYLPMQDYRFSLPYMHAIASGEKHWRTPDKKQMKSVMQHVRSNGAVKARDFEHSATKNADLWGGAKPAKIALEQLFIEGKLMIAHRDRFQKVYDLTERVLPSGIDTTSPTTEEHCRHLIDRTIQSQAFASTAEIGYLRKGLKPDLEVQIQQMLADNEIVSVQVRGNPTTYYSRLDTIESAGKIRVAKRIHLLSPFDNLVIQRKRIASLFDFDYQVECYVPEKKRKHGYFCLPILFGENLVGRIDSKADRKNRKLIVHNLVIEKELKSIDKFLVPLARKITELAEFNGCDRTVIQRCNLKNIRAKLSQLV